MGKTFGVAVIWGRHGRAGRHQRPHQPRLLSFGGQLELGGGYVHWTQPNIWCELQRHRLTVQPPLEAGRSFWLADGKVHTSSTEEIMAVAAHLLVPLFADARARFPSPTDPTLVDKQGIAQLLHAVAVYFGEFFAFFETAGTWAVQGGTKKVADAILAESAAELRLSTPVDAVHDHGRRVIISMRAGDRAQSRAAVLPIPLNTLSNVKIITELTPAARAIIDRKNPVRSHKIWIRVRGEVEPFAIFSPPGQSPINAARTEKHHEGDTIVLCMFSDADLIDPTDRTANAPHSPSLPEDCHPVDQLLPEVGRNILELLGSIEWFSWMSCSATILMRPHAGAAPYQDYGYASLKHCSLNGPAHAIPREPTVEDSIIARAQSRQHTVTSLWFQDVLGDVVDLAVNHAGSIVVLLWRSLTLMALLALALQGLMAGAPEYNDFEQHYDAVTTLIASWRSTFGGITPTTLSGLDRLPARVRRCVLFGATDGDLAILLFHKLVRQVQQHLGDRTLLTAHARFHAKLSSAIPYCHEQRLISATHISYLASTNLAVSSPGFQGGRGLKANVQDIDAHLQPALVVKPYALAAETFADNIKELMPRLETKALVEMTSGLNRCLQGLQTLEDTLIMFPDSEYLENLHNTLSARHNANYY
ncbi:amine oxidase [Aspergillus udagawae]|uniref:Amine oxidase n=1 Tax=Aspergillus udagawae TaxID=91492 RepID=A0ABQ1AZL8_9EURO|nr:amine oxidase [Aspergillus udagawae]